MGNLQYNIGSLDIKPTTSNGVNPSPLHEISYSRLGRNHVGDQRIALQCYKASLRARSRVEGLTIKRIGSWSNIYFLDLDPCQNEKDWRPQPMEDLKEVQIGTKPSERIRVRGSLEVEEEKKIVRFLIENWDIFAWTPEDMPGIDVDFLCHRLSVAMGAHLVSQKKRKLGEEKRRSTKDKTSKQLLATRLIREVCPKDPYIVLSIDYLVDRASGYNLLSFMDAYLGYN
ncbi:hypothetical protein CR513_07238, partial [Mucuna pruriens]